MKTNQENVKKSDIKTPYKRRIMQKNLQTNTTLSFERAQIEKY